MKRKLWFLLIIVLMVISFGKIFIVGKNVEVWLNLSKMLVHDSSEVGFSYCKIDSVFYNGNYRYFLFVDASSDGKIPLDGFEDSVLVLTSNKTLLNGMKSDVFVLPESLLEFWVNKNMPSRLYFIKEVIEQDGKNMYRLRKVK